MIKPIGGRGVASMYFESPRTAQHYESDLLVVLDMDECLIHSNADGGKMAAFPGQCSCTMEPEPDEFHDFEFNKRPHVDDFLQKVSARHEIQLCTTATQVYVDCVLKELDPSGSIFSKCLLSRWDIPSHGKDLTIINHPMSRVILVDDLHHNISNRSSNGIVIKEFIDDPKDTALLDLLKLLEKLDGMEDVRPFLKDKYNDRDHALGS